VPAYVRSFSYKGMFDEFSTGPFTGYLRMLKT
jgi:hypothetical protein